MKKPASGGVTISDSSSVDTSLLFIGMVIELFLISPSLLSFCSMCA